MGHASKACAATLQGTVVDLHIRSKSQTSHRQCLQQLWANCELPAPEMLLRLLSRALTEGRRAAGPLASRAAEPLRTTGVAAACSGGARAFAAVPEAAASEPIVNEPTDGACLGLPSTLFLIHVDILMYWAVIFGRIHLPEMNSVTIAALHAPAK